MHCRLLRKFLGESEIAINYNGSGWEYRSIEVNNLALRKTVNSSSIPPWASNTTLQASVDGRTDASSWMELFLTNYEHHPWLTINLGGLAIIKNVLLYNRKDENGRWLHNVEIRVGNSFTWSEMEFCGLFVGPSQTGKVHTIECVEPLYGTYVTAKIVELNYILDDLNASGGNNMLVLEEIVVNGFFV
ncbi:uncharacterized protein LOC125653607 [Ostrea edulis]|uniref:uncharacterized protein LOC125653607 n=1 Tax=Ostrea edulis TaxID=37623 RepID=UPI0024AECCD4|nr:uncharacterized protein LOC125653607 [Ostrea edulis]